MASKNVIELVDGAYKIKPNQGKSVIKTLLKTLKVILWENPLAPWSYNRNCHFSQSQETPECPFNQPQIPERPLKPIVDDLPKSSVSYQNTFLKEIEIGYINISANPLKKDLKNLTIFLSSKTHNSHSQVEDFELVVELLKNRLSTLEK